MTNDNKLELTILMPCLNEAETLAICIRKARQFLMNCHVDGEILIADNGSIDGSQEIALENGARVIHVPERGYGAALTHGILQSFGKYIIMGDADDSYDFMALQPFLEKLQEGYDLVMGNRFQGEIKPGAMPFSHRYIGNPLLSGIGRLFFNCDVGDFHSGLRGFNRDSIINLNLRTTGMEFASEMVVKSALFNLKIAEVPIILYPDGRSRAPHLRTWSDGWRHLRFLLLFCPKWLFLYPGLILTAFSILLTAILLYQPIKVGVVYFDIGTLLYATTGIIIGIQSVIFFTFTKVYGVSVGLLPKDPLINRVLNYIRIETGVTLGFILTITGVVSSLIALDYWGNHSFGSLDPSISLRLIIPGAMLVIIGFQIILASFFLSILGLKHR